MMYVDELFKIISERLNPWEVRTFTSLIQDFRFNRIEETELDTSLQLLFEKHEDLYQRFKQVTSSVKEDDEDLEEGEIRDGDPKIQDENPKEEDPIHGESRIEADREVRVEKYVKFEDKKLTGIEEEMKKCEDHMYEVDMLMEALRSAVDSAEKVMRGEMELKDLGGKFYRCVEMLYGGDMFEIVTEDHQRALPVILKRLNQKLRDLTAARERLKPIWKKLIEENSAKQRDSSAQGNRKK
ncbi:Histone deacetylase interacting domain [Arabidopsis suecica]|uniref:Histone deacetylase interacting domain n=1 Tax=Arabidopsis suecica TaxID=45249 RepID=A0A8T2B9F1_ARASU|nr:Histone deacetylase interacting domain [Arabidopsis suecica]